MARYGIPERGVSDNGPQYSSSEFQDFAKKYEFEHVSLDTHNQMGRRKARLRQQSALQRKH